MFLSIIIPIYKVEPYISRCLNSCLQQTKVILGKDYEIIAVDDGSPDNSGKITDELLADKHGCTVIHQENKGLSEARNAGLYIAQGEYVWYVDSDDWIETDAVSQLYTIVKDSDSPDVIMIRSQVENDNGPQNIWHKEWKNETITKTGLQVLCEDPWLTPAQFFIVNRSFILSTKLKFKPGILHEDNHYTPRLLYFAKMIRRTNKVLYHSYVNSNSITTTPNPKRSFDLLSTCNDLSLFADNHYFSKKEGKMWNKFIAITLNSALFLIKNHSEDIKIKFNTELSNSSSRLFYRMRHSGSIRHIMEGIIFKYSRNYIYIYNLLIRGLYR